MRTFTTNGEVWRVVRVDAGDPSLIDRTGRPRLATTDPRERVISISCGVEPPLLDRVLIHEIAHAISVSWGLFPEAVRMVAEGDLVGIDEWSARLIENHAIEAINAATIVLGRPVCVRGECSDKLGDHRA